MRSLKPIMIVGAGSDVGKTTLVTALSRIFSNRNVKATPFKSQNMSLNSYVTLEGEEIARSTVVQAFAARQEPIVHMNPILLKSNGDHSSQVIFHGKVVQNHAGSDYFLSHDWYEKKKAAVLHSLEYLRSKFELIIAEGAGSCAEPNLRERDLVNMGLAHLINADAYLVVDIDKGGAFSDILGVLRVMELTYPADKSLLRGFIINKFRGNRALLQPAIQMIEDETELPVLGVIPYLQIDIEEEDSVREIECSEPEIDIAVIYLPHIANSSDFNPLRHEKGVRLRFIKSREELGAPDLIILPGSKNTLWDLNYIRQVGLEDAIIKMISTTSLMGICGGFEMMGKELCDPFQIESLIGRLAGMAFFDFKVILERQKTVKQVHYFPMSDNIFEQAGPVQGYEIHCGEIIYGMNCQPIYSNDSSFDGALMHDESRFIMGTFVHDIFKNARFTRELVNYLRQKKGLSPILMPLIQPKEIMERQYDRLASHIETHCPALVKDLGMRF